MTITETTNESDVKLRECPFCGAGIEMRGKFYVHPSTSCFLDQASFTEDSRFFPLWNIRHNDHLLEMAAEALRFYANEEFQQEVIDVGSCGVACTYDSDTACDVAKAALLALQQHGYRKE